MTAAIIRTNKTALISDPWLVVWNCQLKLQILRFCFNFTDTKHILGPVIYFGNSRVYIFVLNCKCHEPEKKTHEIKKIGRLGYLVHSSWWFCLYLSGHECHCFHWRPCVNLQLFIQLLELHSFPSSAAAGLLINLSSCHTDFVFGKFRGYNAIKHLHQYQIPSLVHFN